MNNKKCIECKGEGSVESQGSYGAINHPTCLRCMGSGKESDAIEDTPLIDTAESVQSDKEKE